MKLSKVISVIVLVLLIVSASSCGTLRRVTKNAVIGASSAALVLVAASADSYRDATATREGYQTGAVTEVLSFPLFFLWNAVKILGRK